MKKIINIASLLTGVAVLALIFFGEQARAETINASVQIGAGPVESCNLIRVQGTTQLASCSRQTSSAWRNGEELRIGIPACGAPILCDTNLFDRFMNLRFKAQNALNTLFFDCTVSPCLP